MQHPTLLIIDDDPAELSVLKEYIKTEGNYDVIAETDPREALKRLTETSIDLVLSDWRMPGITGLDVLNAVRELREGLPVVIFSGYDEPTVIVEAIQKGAADFLSKPLKPEVLFHAIDAALQNRQLKEEVSKLKRRLGGDHRFGGLIGRSAAMHMLFDLVQGVADVDSTALIRGETGVGKELVARALHFEGTRRDKPFVKVNCSALPETLLESELFGHEKGAFTDARQQRIGKFEQANGGTIFLDEIGDLSLTTQVKLLNVLQDREFERIGGNQRIRLNIRLISATNRDLESLIRAGRFRLDLYYRLNVVPITILPLRDRPEDIPLLCAHFLDKIGGRLNKGEHTLADEAMSRLITHAWPGNVRELENAIERAILATPGTSIGSEAFSFLGRTPEAPQAFSGPSLPLLEGFVPEKPAPGNAMPPPGPLKNAVRDFERSFIERTLQASHGQVIRAARLLKIDRTTLWKKAKDLGIDMHSDPL
ncbi:sigma-54 dependent transcriptional regulator [bacterium]|nr:sigma-54 dependent transcriptional regulator [bacterium]